MPDFAVFNELSASTHASSEHQALSWLSGILELMQKLRVFGIRHLRTRPDFRDIILVEGVRLTDLVRKLGNDKMSQLSIIMRSPYLEGSIEDRYLEYQIRSVGETVFTSAEGLLCAYLTETLSISLASGAPWGIPNIELGLHHEPSDTPVDAEVTHASGLTHLVTHLMWACRTYEGARAKAASHDAPLPNTRLSDLLIPGGWDQYFRSNSSLNVQERTASLKETAEKVAIINGYEIDKVLSKKNTTDKKMRQVFVLAGSARAMFLSTDFEKPAGAFEVYDRHGIHLGEWLFSGKPNGSADTTGKHDIKL